MWGKSLAVLVCLSTSVAAAELPVGARLKIRLKTYPALSLRERCALVTAGNKLYNAIHPAFPNIVSLANWP